MIKTKTSIESIDGEDVTVVETWAAMFTMLGKDKPKWWIKGRTTYYDVAGNSLWVRSQVLPNGGVARYIAERFKNDSEPDKGCGEVKGRG